ncbi:MAG: SDR family NAD(P)-dependent oxidoreductase [Acidimicrobiia bacterium]|nr:SDR family NAD(P)-dependent oxidoreductase [Acidimicrobiia bacterium]
MRDAVGAIQSAMVLGGTSEIGLATATALVGRGCSTVVLACRDVAGGNRAAEALRAVGATVHVEPFEATDAGSHVALFDRVTAEVGDLDLLLVAAGALGDHDEMTSVPARAAELIDVNFAGMASATLAGATTLRRQGHGTIVVISSVAAERARADNYVYGSSKAGLDAFAQGLGDAMRNDGVRVMVVRPGFVHTRMTEGLDPAPFSTTPDAVANAVVRGLERDSEIVWVPSVLRWVFVAMRHLPRGIWRKVSAR